MIRKNLKSFLFFFILFFCVFSFDIYGQSNDLMNDVNLSCVTFTPDNGYNRWPEENEKGVFTGVCPASKKCDIVIKLPTGEYIYNNGLVVLDSGKNFFSHGIINERGSLVNIKDHAAYNIYAAYTKEPLGKGVNDDDPSQKLGQEVFYLDPGSEVCKEIYWDPYGRVFDSVSLEPFNKNQAIVTLLDENDNPSKNTFMNNVYTDEMGKYNILINKDGNYKLKAESINHIFTSKEPNLKYKELYGFIYKLGDPPFYETAKNPKRVDIALTPKDKPYTRIPEFITREYLDVWHRGETYTKISLRTVHPKTIIKVMIDGIEITEDGEGKPLAKTSDKEGYWLALIKKEVFSQNGFTIELIKNPQYYPFANENNTSFLKKIIGKLFSLFNKNVIAQQKIKIDDNNTTTNSLNSSKNVTVIKFDPILEYIEGYSYGNDNKIIPNAKVNVRLKSNKKIYSSTTTDDSGFFTLYPKDLPPYEYYLEFIDSSNNSVVIQTTSQFVEKNQPYLDSKKIDLIKMTKMDKKISTPTISNLNTYKSNDFDYKNNNLNNIKPTLPVETKKSIFNSTILIVILIISLLVIVSLALIFYIKKQKSIPY